MSSSNKSSKESIEYNKSGLDFYNNGEYEKAREYYKKAIEADSEFIDAYYNLSIAYCENKQFGYAVSQLNEALTIEPDNAKIHLQLGSVYYQMGQYQKSLSFYEKTLKCPIVRLTTILRSCKN